MARPWPQKEIFTVRRVDLEKLAEEISTAHYESSFTDQKSLYSWIYHALKEVQLFGHGMAHQEFENYLKRQALDRNGNDT